MKRLQDYFRTDPGSPPPVRVHVTNRRARFSEVDALGIVWHGRYASFFEEAHTELTRKCGISWKQLRDAGLSAPIVQFHVDYLRTLRLDEEFETEAALFWNEGARVNVQYTLRDSASGTIHARGYTVQIFTELESGTPLWFSPELWEECRTRWKKGEFHHAESK